MHFLVGNVVSSLNNKSSSHSDAMFQDMLIGHVRSIYKIDCIKEYSRTVMLVRKFVIV
jgi:hypothetical protein